MLLPIPELLDAATLQALRARIDAGEWIDGNVTSGHQSALAKNNLQLTEAGAEARDGGQIILDALQPWLRRANILRFNAEGDELGLGQAVVALGQLTPEHIGIFFADVIKVIVLIRD